MSGKEFSIYLLLVVMLVGCGQSRAQSTPDPWYRAPPAGDLSYWQWPELDPARIHQVAETRQAEAQEMLDDVALVELTARQAADLVGGTLPDAAGTTLYLTRSLYRNPGTGRYAVYVLEDRLLVHHGSLGTGTWPMRRRALVLQLEQSPNSVRWPNNLQPASWELLMGSRHLKPHSAPTSLRNKVGLYVAQRGASVGMIV
jgi:hypothetical protein